SGWNRRTDLDAAEQMPGGPGADDAFQYQELYEAIGTLPLKEKSAVLLFYVSGYSVKEIAKITGGSQLAVKQQLSRGRVKLRQILER
ncbi:MAG: sigma-70 family RNA polymerase sigma factor, partial [Bacteroidales bacterium]|nr:sigma-70 family RNA polymerase sigma factor [Bacteroidales bacterium]